MNIRHNLGDGNYIVKYMRYLPRRSHVLRAQVGVKPRVLIIVQNLPVPFDRRVWLECQALVSAGYRVAVVCPKGIVQIPSICAGRK
jgi:hypothetical protein